MKKQGQHVFHCLSVRSSGIVRSMAVLQDFALDRRVSTSVANNDVFWAHVTSPRLSRTSWPESKNWKTSRSTMKDAKVKESRDDHDNLKSIDIQRH